MKIIFVTYCRAMFGANLCMLTMIKDMVNRYHIEPLVIVPAVNDGDLEEVLIKENIPYIVSETKPWVVLKGTKLRLLRGLKASICSNKFANEIANKLNADKYDLVYSNNSVIQLGADIARKLKIPHVWHVREYATVHYDLAFTYPNLAVRRKFRAAKKVITTSNDLERFVKNTIDGKLNTKAIYDGIESSRVSPSHQERDSKVCNFIYVGVLQPGKNQMELLEAAVLLKEMGRDDFHIYLVGSGDEYEKELREYCHSKKIDDYVTFMGYRTDFEEIYPKMHVGVICSKAEAFGRVTVEYMLQSLPVIGANNTGTAEIIENGVTGYLYELGNIEQLKNCMLTLMDDTELSEKYGKAGFERAINMFTSDRNTDEIYKVFEEVTNA